MLWWTLRQLKSKNEKKRIQAAEKLGGFRNTHAIQPLVSALNDKNWSVRKAAAHALGKIGDSQAVQPLVSAALEDRNEYVRLAAAKELESLGWQPTDDSQRALHTIAIGDWDRAATLGAAAIQPLVAAIKNGTTPSEREAVAKALSEIRETQAVQPLVAVLKDKDSSVREAAARALGKIGDVQAVQPLAAAIDNREFDLVTVEAAWALGGIGDAQAVRPLVAALKGCHWKVKQRAAEALGKIGDAQAVQPLLALLEDEISWARRAAAKALGEIGDAQAVRPLVAALEDDDSSVQATAAGALGKIGDAQVVELLVELTAKPDRAEQAINVLELVLEKNAQLIPLEDLQALSALNNVVRFRYNYECNVSNYKTEVPVNCSRLRQLARQELIRRGQNA